MKTLIKLACMALLPLLCACDDIDESNRFSGPVEFTPKKNVLIEDFTGQRCLNCPLAANAVNTLQNTYGKEHIIAVAIHGGNLSIPAPGGFATETGQQYNSYWGVDSWPKGLVDRAGGWDANKPGDALLEYTSWSAQAVKRMQLDPMANITIDQSTYDPSTGMLTVKTTVEGNTDIDGFLQVWLTESHISSIQIMPDGSMNKTYEHNHVFRATLNGTWGETIQLSEGENTSVEHTFSLTDQPTWKPEKLAVVAFVYNKTQGVMQAVDREVEPLP